ncbi:MAG: IS66 family transposase [Bacteroidales bacterium]|nr:IS66 family transposase [Bacteroidales bacterium]
MKEQVLDIDLVLQSIKGKIDGLTQQLEAVTKENVKLKERIVYLEDCLAVYETPKNSNNSSIPPSKDSLAAQGQKSKQLLATRSLREKSGKPSGGQVGHKGTTLEMTSEPDSIIEHQPYFCTRCGNDLSSIEGTVVEIRQVFDVPMPIRPIVIEHHQISKQCSCGHCSQTDFPIEVRSRVSYGTKIQALVTYLNSNQYIPYKRLTEVLRDCFGVNLSQGTIDNILQDMSDKSVWAYNEIRNRVEQSRVVGADETGENVNGDLHWMWAWQTPNLTYVHSDKSRGKLAIDKQFKNGFPNSTLVTDRHSSYFNMNVADHQICLAHILRELKFLSDLDTNQRWSSELAELIREAIHKRKTESWEQIDRNSILDRFKNLLTTSTDNLNKKIIALIKSLTKYKEFVFKFLFDPDVPYENNASERAVRNLKVKQKVSGMFKSNDGADAYCRIHSITQTAKKNNQNPFLAILAVANNY